MLSQGVVLLEAIIMSEPTLIRIYLSKHSFHLPFLKGNENDFIDAEAILLPVASFFGHLALSLRQIC